MWRCPLCQAKLKQKDRSFSCENRHTFDQAKSGYLNLLPVQHKRSKQPGDDKAMLNARRRFHDSRGYQSLMDAISAQVCEHVENTEPLTLYDAGCGEGSYLGYLSDVLTERGYSVIAQGSDIAKHAVDIAAKRYSTCHFAVASSKSLPVVDGAITVALQVFAPGSPQEYSRVIGKNGLLITVDPGPDHLWEIKQAIYDTPKKHAVNNVDLPGFDRLSFLQVAFELTLEVEEVKQALLAMTPYYWRLPRDKASELTADIPRVKADFTVQVWRHSGQA